jgi:hypothetical protein
MGAGGAASIVCEIPYAWFAYAAQVSATARATAFAPGRAHSALVAAGARVDAGALHRRAGGGAGGR